MALRKSITQLPWRSTPSSLSKASVSHNVWPYKQRSSLATIAPAVTQSSVGSQGPTAIVFMNMGGPSTTDEVGDFLSRLFVGPAVGTLSSETDVVTGRW
jgi:protoporphyrin/coproporphyrin ferrochelatase